MSSLDLAEFIIRQIHKLNLTRTEVAKRAGFSRETLYKLLNAEDKQPEPWTLVQLAHALNVAPLFLIRLTYGGSAVPVYTTTKPKHIGDYSSFVRDVTFPDNSIVSPNQHFEKIWEIQNTGKIEWDGRYLKCLDEDIITICERNNLPISSYLLIPHMTKLTIPLTKPDETIQLSVNYCAPLYPCTTFSYWKMYDSKDEQCFPGMKGIWCCVKVMAI